MSGSVCLNVEKMTPFVNVFDVSFSFGIDFDIVQRRLSLYYVSAVLPIAHDCSLTGVGFHPTNKIYVFTSVD